MKIFSKRKPKTDEEYIESIRKSYKRRWWIYIPLVLLFFLLFIFSLYMGMKFEKQCINMFDEVLKTNPVPISKENLKLQEDLKQMSVATSYYF